MNEKPENSVPSVSSMVEIKLVQYPVRERVPEPLSTPPSP